MYRSIVGAVNKAARQYKIKYIMPSGTAIQNARTSFAGDHLNRDGYHLDLGFDDSQLPVRGMVHLQDVM